MSDTREEEEPVGMDFRADETVKQLAMALARTVSDKHGTNNGPTALYWALMVVISKHAATGHERPRPGPTTYP